MPNPAKPPRPYSMGGGATMSFPISSRTPLFTPITDRKSTRLNSSHSQISYAVFCLKKKKHQVIRHPQQPNSPVKAHPAAVLQDMIKLLLGLLDRIGYVEPQASDSHELDVSDDIQAF